MVEVNNQLIYEVLKKIRRDAVHIKARVDDNHQQFIALREQLHSVQGDVLRLERQGSSVSHRLERIEQRLGFVDA